MVLGEYLKNYRIKHNLTQNRMAYELGTSQSYYSRIESGKTKPGMLMIRTIAYHIGVSESYIVRLNNENNK